MNPDVGQVVRLAWLHFWQVTVVAVVVGVAVRLFCRHRPRLAYSLWMLVLVKALVPPFWSSPTGVFSWALAEPPTTSASDIGRAASPSGQPARVDYPEGRSVASPAPGVVERTTPDPVRRPVADRLPHGLTAIWLSGLLVGSAAVLVQRWRWSRLLSRAYRPADRDLSSSVVELSRRLHVGRKVRVLISSEFVGPLVLGVFRPTLVIPESLLSQASPDQVRVIIAHELVHVRRGDIFAGFLQTVAQLLWWFHPLIWWASREASRERERCCDQEVVTGLGCGPATYARTLLRVLELKITSRPQVAVPGIGHSRVTALRMEFIMRHAGSQHRFAASFSRLAFAVGAVLLLPGLGLTVDARPKSDGIEEATITTEAVEHQEDERPEVASVPITVTGRAVDEAGRPVAGATIYLQSTNGIEASLGTTATDEDGRYEFRDAKLLVRAVEDGPVQGTFQVYGTAPGEGFSWHGMRHFIDGQRDEFPPAANEDFRIFRGEPIEMDLKFRPPARLRGRVVDQDGRPVAGVIVGLGNSDWLDTEGMERHQNFREFWSIDTAPTEMTTAETGDDGRFEITGLPSEAGFWVHFQHPNYARRNLFYATTNRPTTELDYPHVSYLREQPRVETGELTVEFVATRTLSVRVAQADGGEPVSGVRVNIGPGVGGTNAHGTTDAEGGVVLKLPPGDYPAHLDPSRESEFIRTYARVRVEDQPQDQAAEFHLDPGCILILEAVDAEAGEGIPEASFMEERVSDGRRVWSRLQSSTTHVDNPKTDDEGQLRAVVRPGSLRIRLGSLPRGSGYEYSIETKSVDLPAGETVRVRFELRKPGEEK